MSQPYFRIIRVLAVGAVGALAVSCVASRNRAQSLRELDVACRSEVESSAECVERTFSERMFREECIVEQEGIAAGRAAVAIPLAALDSLPEGAVFGAREGHTAVAVRRAGDKLVVEARSDSVARTVTQVRRFEMRESRDSAACRTVGSAVSTTDTLHSEFRSRSVAARRSSAGWWWFAAGFALCAVLLVWLKR